MGATFAIVDGSLLPTWMYIAYGQEGWGHCSAELWDRCIPNLHMHGQGSFMKSVNIRMTCTGEAIVISVRMRMTMGQANGV